MEVLPKELKDKISAFANTFPTGGAAQTAANPGAGRPGPAQAEHCLSVALYHWPCTEKFSRWAGTNGFDGNQNPFTFQACPNDRVGSLPPYQGRIQTCQEHRFQMNHPHAHMDKPDGIAYVCEDHFNGTKTWW